MRAPHLRLPEFRAAPALELPVRPILPFWHAHCLVGGSLPEWRNGPVSCRPHPSDRAEGGSAAPHLAHVGCGASRGSMTRRRERVEGTRASPERDRAATPAGVDRRAETPPSPRWPPRCLRTPDPDPPTRIVFPKRCGAEVVCGARVESFRSVTAVWNAEGE